MKEQTQINHPDYYQLDGGLETIDVIDSLGLGPGFELGCAIKYIFRAGKKPGTTTQEDIKKAIWYLDHYVQKLKDMEASNDKTATQAEQLLIAREILECPEVTS